MDLQKFEDYLRTLDFDTLVRAWNEYCWDSGASTDGEIYESIESLHDDGLCTGIDLARALFFGSVESWNDRVYFDGYGNLQSTWDLDNSPIDISYLAEWLRDENHRLYEEWEDEQREEWESEDEEV